MAERLANEILDASNASVLLSSAARILIRWQRPTRPSLTTAGNFEIESKEQQWH